MGGEKLSCISLLGELLESPPQCGEKMEIMLDVWTYQGSPPHRRGKAGENHLVAQLPGITPAQAGKSEGFFSTPRTAWDHPRVGGEKFFGDL